MRDHVHILSNPVRVSGKPLADSRARAGAGTNRPQSPTRSVVWIAMLFAAICFEGLGRVLLPQIPSIVLYLLKDVVLLTSLFFVKIPGDILPQVRQLVGKWFLFVPIAVAWTIIQVFNPDQISLPLAALGLRSYWLWWIAPVLIAAVVRTERNRNQAILILGLFAIFIAFYASAQFASPPDSGINSYALYNGEVVMKTSSVQDTGKARVSGTFSYISGFGDFAIAASAILLAFGIDMRGRSRALALLGGLLIAASGAMTGSRNVVIFIVVSLGIILFRSGFFRLRQGRVAIGLLILTAGFAFYRTSDAARGVKSRFELGDTSDRIERELGVFPPVALSTLPYPLFGIGTGMQQSARIPLGIITDYVLEDEPPRLLVELGAIGYLLFWFARFGLLVGLVRASAILKRAGKPGASGGAWSLATLTMFQRLVFDHVWQALYFASLGLILSATLGALRARKASGGAAVPNKPAPPRGGIAGTKELAFPRR